MRMLLLIGLLCASGCASIVPMAELEHKAMLSGDWTAVEKRERAIARREARRGPQCPSGYVAYCVNRMADSRCRCVTGSALQTAFSGIY